MNKNRRVVPCIPRSYQAGPVCFGPVAESCPVCAMQVAAGVCVKGTERGRASRERRKKTGWRAVYQVCVRECVCVRVCARVRMTRETRLGSPQIMLGVRAGPNPGFEWNRCSRPVSLGLLRTRDVGAEALDDLDGRQSRDPSRRESCSGRMRMALLAKLRLGRLKYL